MKRSTKYKFGSLVLLSGILIGFNQCIAPVNSQKSNLKYSENGVTKSSSSGVVVARSVSLDAFSKSVYVVTKAHCSSCHGTIQTPLHASSDVNIAFDSIINSSKVDLTNPSNSRLVLKLRNEKHNCWGNCSDNASEMESQVLNWKNAIGISSTESTTQVSGNTTKETITIDEALNPSNSSNSNAITLMTESASLKTPMILAVESGVSYIWVPSGNANKDLTSQDAGIGYINYSVNVSDFYKIFVLVNVASSNSNSVYVKAAGSDYKEWVIAPTSGFEWRAVTNTSANLETDFYMANNKVYNLELRQKNAGVKIAKAMFSNDSSFNPTSTPKSILKATLSVSLADLTGIPGSSFEMDIEDFDMYSYKVSNPRIKTSKNVLIKKLKVLVNGIFNPQHSTYLVVNKLVTSQDGLLSSANMILLKDKGASFDKLSFSFETIQVEK